MREQGVRSLSYRFDYLETPVNTNLFMSYGLWHGVYPTLSDILKIFIVLRGVNLE